MPKGVLWRQHDIFLSAMGGRNILTQEKVETYDDLAAQAAAFPEPLKFLILPPLMHGAAQWVTFIALNNGHAIVFPDDTKRFDPAEALRTIERDRCTTLTVVGDAIARPLVEELESGTYDMSSLMSVGNGGAPLTPTIKARLLEQLPNIFLTDSVGVVRDRGPDEPHVDGERRRVQRSVQPRAGHGRRQRGARQGARARPRRHRLARPGPGWVPLGYFADPDKTARTFPVIDGVRYSVPGDRARLLADGEVELLGRDSVTINSGGEKIFAEEVERAIAGHPAVHDVVVVGRASERWGQEVVAIVELSPDATATPDDIVAHAGNHVARYKLPKDVLFLDAIQRSPSGKADYRWAKAQVQPAEG